MVNNGIKSSFDHIQFGSHGGGKTLVLLFIIASFLLWSPDLAYCSDTSNYNEQENEKSIVEDTKISESTILLNGSKDQPPQSEDRIRAHSDNNFMEKKTHREKIGLPEDAIFLAGPSPHDHFLYSNHSCSCHSSTSSFSDHSVSTTNNPSRAGNDEGVDTCKSDDNSVDGENEQLKPCEGRIFYLVSIHNDRTLSDALYLFRSIRDSQNIVLIHIDTKFGLESYYNSPLHKEIEACPCGSRVEVASVYDCMWGSWSMNLPTLWSMEKAVKEYSGKWDVFINLSGDTLPVYSQNRIAKLFGGPLRGMNFVTSIACETGLVPTSILEFPIHWHKRSHYSYQPANNLTYVDDDGERHYNVKVDIFFGSQWVSLTPKYCDFLIKQLSRPDSLPSRFRDWLIDTNKLMADETFFTSILMRYFPETIPTITSDFFLDTTDSNFASSIGSEVSMYAIRYERMDEHVPSSKGYFPTEQRYEVPSSSGVEQPKAWGPYFLGTYDLNNIRLSGALFVRKVARSIDPNLYKILPVDIPQLIPPISWPNDVKISPVPDWEKTLSQYRKNAAKDN